MIVAVGGPPGGGKTTAAERFAEAHAFALVSAGAKFRERARVRGIDLAAFGRLAESDHDIDRALDHEVLEDVLRYDAAGRDVIVDGRIQAQLLAQRRVPCVKVFIDAPLDVRAKRIAGREGQTIAVAREQVVKREASERVRYKAIYGIDVADRSLYDILVDSSDKTPDEIAALIWSKVGG